ncbi:MAG TPA: hypothetical protein VGO47_04280, partial [Chlamydiales bacterium]|nr:hypothetical protein [Chlamydiales bacterium]
MAMQLASSLLRLWISMIKIFDFHSPGDFAQYESANPAIAVIQIIFAQRCPVGQYEDPAFKDASEKFLSQWHAIMHMPKEG